MDAIEDYPGRQLRAEYRRSLPQTLGEAVSEPAQSPPAHPGVVAHNRISGPPDRFEPTSEPGEFERLLGLLERRRASLGGRGTATSHGLLPATVRDKDLWSVPKGPWTEVPGGRSRPWTAGDSNGDWTEYEVGGNNWRVRRYREGDSEWEEAISGDNRWRTRPGGPASLSREAVDKGLTILELPDGEGRTLAMEIAGNASPEELGRVRQALEAMPAPARKHAQKIVLVDSLGQVSRQAMALKQEAIGGLAGNTEGRVALARSVLATDSATTRVLFHEAGHNLSAVSGRPEQTPAWPGDKGSVTLYGERNATEDFAETHRFVLTHWDRFVNSKPENLESLLDQAAPPDGTAWKRPAAEKVGLILRLYGWGQSG